MRISSAGRNRVVAREQKPNCVFAGDAIALEHPERCRICSLPLPSKDDGGGICSRRCSGRKVESAQVAADAVALKARILVEVALLKPATTVCPGELSLRVLPQTLLPLTLLRPLIFELAAARKLILRQQKTVVLWHKIRGPFRVGGR